MMSRFLVINFILFQASWFMAAFYSQHAAIFILSVVILHFMITPTRGLDTRVLLVGVLGILADQLLIMFGVIDVGQPFIPLWLLMLWLMFSICLNHSLAWLQQLSLYWVAGIGAVFGTLSYVAALNFGAINTAVTKIEFVFIEVLVWLLLLPLMIFSVKAVHYRQGLTDE